MKCCKCGAEEDHLIFNGMKLRPETCAPYKISNAVLNVKHIESDPYYVLCPDCYKEIFEGLPTVTDVIEVKQKYL